MERLDHLKASKMKELFLKKQIELEEICNRSHMEIPSQSEMDNIMNLINSGKIKFFFSNKNYDVALLYNYASSQPDSNVRKGRLTTLISS